MIPLLFLVRDTNTTLKCLDDRKDELIDHQQNSPMPYQHPLPQSARKCYPSLADIQHLDDGMKMNMNVRNPKYKHILKYFKSDEQEIQSLQQKVRSIMCPCMLLENEAVNEFCGVCRAGFQTMHDYVVCAGCCVPYHHPRAWIRT